MSLKTSQFDKRKYQMDQRMQEFRRGFKNIDEQFIDMEMKVPEILFLANKSENGHEGDLLADFYQMFPHISEPDEFGNVKEPIFISAEHGDGLPDLY